MQYFSQTISGSFDGILAILFLCLIAFVFLGAIFVIIYPIFYVSAHIRRKAEDFKNKRLSAIIAQYEPPRNLSPAEVGYLYDMRCGKNELIATLFHLELRGIIKINNSNTADVVDDQAYALLQEYEKIAIRSVNNEYAKKDTPKQVPFTYIVNDGPPRTMTFTLPPDKSLRAYANAVQQSLKDKGIPMRSFWMVLLRKSFAFSIVLCVLPIFLFSSVDGMFNDTPYTAWSLTAFGTSIIYALLLAVFVWPVYFIFSAIVIYLWANIAGRYWLNTKKARAVWPELEGYKKFIESVDLDNIQFEATDSQGYSVRETLPYAIVFNLETKWQKLLAKRANSSA